MSLKAGKDKGQISVVLTAPQKAWLEERTAALDISIGELVRRIIDQARGQIT